MKHQNHMFISTGAEAFDNVQLPFIIKILNKVDAKGNFLNIIKAIYEKSQPNIINNGEKQKTFFPMIQYKARMLTLATSI